MTIAPVDPKQETVPPPGGQKPAWDARSTLFLDGLRGLAALYVAMHHAFWLLQEGYTAGYLAHPAAYSRAQKIVALASSSIFRLGHEAVLFFFVLSGFVIHLRYARRITR